MGTENIAPALQQVQDEIDKETATGFRGARVDPFPNSAYSQETDPMTSPGPNDVPPGGYRFVIDEYVDPDSPRAEISHTREGIIDGSAEEEALETSVETTNAPARGAAVDGNIKLSSADFDGQVTASTFKSTAAIVGDPANNRVFTVRNETKGVDMRRLVTTANIAAGAEVPIPAINGASQAVSAGDEIRFVETHNGTGVASGGGVASVTVTETE